jgi:hypothetical protein
VHQVSTNKSKTGNADSIKDKLLHKKLWYHESNKYSNWQYLGTKYILVSIIISLSMEKESTPGDLQD